MGYCTVCCVIVICFVSFVLLCFNYSFYVFCYSLYVYYLVLFVLMYILWVLYFCIVLCIVCCPHVYSCFFYIYVHVYWPLPPDENASAVRKYHTKRGAGKFRVSGGLAVTFWRRPVVNITCPGGKQTRDLTSLPWKQNDRSSRYHACTNMISWIYDRHVTQDFVNLSKQYNDRKFKYFLVEIY